MPLTSLTGLMGCGLLLVAGLLSVSRTTSLRFEIRLAVFFTAWLVAYVPIGDLALVIYARGVVGDLSMTTLVLLGAYCARYLLGRDLLDRRDRLALFAMVVTGAFFLYPLALGLTYFDPYSLGYGSPGFITALLVLAVAAWHRRFHLIVVCLTVAATAYATGVHESRNLWDYLLDPLVAGYGSIWIFREALDRWARRRLTKGAGSAPADAH